VVLGLGRLLSWLFYRHESAELTRALYAAVLGRAPDASGLAEYRRGIRSARDVGAMLADLIDSREYARRNATDLWRATRPEIVQALYRAILGREPEAHGLEHASAELLSGPDVGALATSLLESAEYHERLRQRLRARSSEISIRDLTEEKLVFLHLPKTGGTTLRHVLAQGFEPARICPEPFNRLQHYCAGELARYRLFSGHFDLPSTQLIPGPKAIVTMVREPTARLISLYFFQRAHPPEIIERDHLELPRLAQRHTIDEFFAAPAVTRHPSIDNALTRTLTQVLPEGSWDALVGEPENAVPAEALLHRALRALDALDAVGVLERYEESARVICARAQLAVDTHIKPRQVLEDLVASREMSLPERAPVTERTLRLLAPLVAADRVLYRRAGERLDAERVAPGGGRLRSG